MSKDNTLSYSLEALRVKARFFGKKAMVYVEGPEDINFWDPYFNREVFEIECVNGCHNLDKYIQQLEDGERSYIVACDSDYNKFKGVKYTSPMIVETYGHSIENMMYCPHNVKELVRKLSTSKVDTLDAINEWYTTFVNLAHPLLVREITNQLYNPKDDKPAVFGNGSARFCKQKKCYELDDDKIKTFCEENKAYFPAEELDKVESALAQESREERHLIKGHFYTDAIRALISFLSKTSSPSQKTVKLANTNLYTMLVHCGHCQSEQCQEKSFLHTEVDAAISNLQFV